MIWCKWVFVIVVNAFLSDFKALIDCTEKAIFELPFASVFIMQIELIFYMTGFARRLVLKQRHKGNSEMACERHINAIFFYKKSGKRLTSNRWYFQVGFCGKDNKIGPGKDLW